MDYVTRACCALGSTDPDNCPAVSSTNNSPVEQSSSNGIIIGVAIALVIAAKCHDIIWHEGGS